MRRSTFSAATMAVESDWPQTFDANHIEEKWYHHWLQNHGDLPRQDEIQARSIILAPPLRDANALIWFQLLTKADLIHRHKRMQRQSHPGWQFQIINGHQSGPTSPSCLFKDLNPGISFPHNQPINRSAGKIEPLLAWLLSHLFHRGLIYRRNKKKLHAAKKDGFQGATRPVVDWRIKTKALGEAVKTAIKNEPLQIHPETWFQATLSWLEGLRDLPLTTPDALPTPHHHLIFCEACREFSTADICPKCLSTDSQYKMPGIADWFVTAASILEWRPGEKKSAPPTHLILTTPGLFFPQVPLLLLLGHCLSGSLPIQEILVEATFRKNTPRPFNGRTSTSRRKTDRELSRDKLRWIFSTATASLRTHPVTAARLKSASSLLNKVWNASRFVCLNTEHQAPVHGEEISGRALAPKDLTPADKWYLHAQYLAIGSISEKMDRLQIADAAESLHQFFRQEFCNWYLEFSKIDAGKESTRRILHYSLIVLLKLLHPFMPFLTEEIFSQMKVLPLVCTESEPPVLHGQMTFPREHALVQELKRLIADTRRLRARHNIPPRIERPVHLQTSDEQAARGLKDQLRYFDALVRSSDTKIHNEPSELPKGFQGESQNWTILLPLESDEEIKNELSRLEKERKKAEKIIKDIETKLLDEQFITNNPSGTVTRLKKRLQTAIDKQRHCLSTIQDLT